MKKFFGLFLITIMLFSTVPNVYAKTLTIDEVSTQFDNSPVFDLVSEMIDLPMDITAQVNSEAHTLDVYYSIIKLFSFNYGDDYIEYNGEDVEIIGDPNMDGLITLMCIMGVADSVFRLSGYDLLSYTDANVTEEYFSDYDTYGFQLDSNNYDLDSMLESANKVKYFKISLDTDKISTFANTLQSLNSENTPSTQITLNVMDTTENSIVLYPHVSSSLDDNIIYGDIYRSTEENGTYEKINTEPVNCTNNITYTDSNLKSGSVYYYKLAISDTESYSEVIAVKTKENKVIPLSSAVSEEDDSLPDNPKTGAFLPITTILLLIVGSIVLFRYTKKKNVFVKL